MTFTETSQSLFTFKFQGQPLFWRLVPHSLLNTELRSSTVYVELEWTDLKTCMMSLTVLVSDSCALWWREAVCFSHWSDSLHAIQFSRSGMESPALKWWLILKHRVDCLMKQKMNWNTLDVLPAVVKMLMMSCMHHPILLQKNKKTKQL